MTADGPVPAERHFKGYDSQWNADLAGLFSLFFDVRRKEENRSLYLRMNYSEVKDLRSF